MEHLYPLMIYALLQSQKRADRVRANPRAWLYPWESEFSSRRLAHFQFTTSLSLWSLLTRITAHLDDPSAKLKRWWYSHLLWMEDEGAGDLLNETKGVFSPFPGPRSQTGPLSHAGLLPLLRARSGTGCDQAKFTAIHSFCLQITLITIKSPLNHH